jgi:hypothetical protein
LEPLTANPSEAPCAFSDASILTPISRIISVLDADSNEYKLVLNRMSGSYISASQLCECLRASTSYFNFSPPFLTLFDLH